ACCRTWARSSASSSFSRRGARQVSESRAVWGSRAGPPALPLVVHISSVGRRRLAPGRDVPAREPHTARLAAPSRHLPEQTPRCFTLRSSLRELPTLRACASRSGG